VTRTVAVDLDGALGDTHPLWDAFVADAARRFSSIAPLAPGDLPSDRGAAAHVLDAWSERGVGDWRRALERFAEDHAPVHLRPDPAANVALRAVKAGGARVVVFTDAPEPLARVALAHLGVARSVDELDTGDGVRERAAAADDVVATAAELAGLADAVAQRRYHHG
jgi:phosphoglycolate phosphatase-like HAD superfamily hydrolase